MRFLPATCLAALALLTGGLAGAVEKAQAGGAPAAASSPQRPAARPLDLNKASAAALMKLPGIGEADARRIVEGRPYKSKADLVTRKVLDLPVYERIKRMVVVDHRRAAAGPKSSRPASPPATSPAPSKPAS